MDFFSKDYTSVSDWNTDRRGSLIVAFIRVLFPFIHRGAEAEEEERNAKKGGQENKTKALQGKSLTNKGKGELATRKAKKR